MSEMEKFTPLAKNFTLPPAVTACTNLTSAQGVKLYTQFFREATFVVDLRTFNCKISCPKVAVV